MPTRRVSISAESAVKAVLFALLAATTATYVFSGRVTEALESSAWYVLLILFGVETGWPGHVARRHALLAMRVMRAVATGAIAFAGIGYVVEREWLDTINTALWIGVILLLEFEVRHAAAVARRRRLYTAAAAALYSGLALLVLLWAARGEWLDAADAALWLAAFGIIEFDLLRRRAPRAPARG